MNIYIYMNCVLKPKVPILIDNGRQVNLHADSLD